MPVFLIRLACRCSAQTGTSDHNLSSVQKLYVAHLVQTIPLKLLSALWRLSYHTPLSLPSTQNISKDPLWLQQIAMSFFFLWNKYAALHLAVCWCFTVSTIFVLKIKSWDRNNALSLFYTWPKGQPLSHKKPVVKCRADSECLGRGIFSWALQMRRYCCGSEAVRMQPLLVEARFVLVT